MSDTTIVISLLVFLIMMEGFFIAFLMQSQQRERETLLNRVMAKDYNEYKTLESGADPAKPMGSPHRLKHEANLSQGHKYD